MADEARKLANGASASISRPSPSRYRHWRVADRGRRRDADHGRRRERRPVRGLSAQAEFLRSRRRHRTRRRRAADALRAPGRRRWCVLRSGKDRVFCAGANIRMLAGSRPMRTRSISASSPTRRATASKTRRENSGQRYICVVNGAARAAATNWRWRPTTSSWSMTARPPCALPEVPLLAVLPGTGGLTRVVDKRKVRRDLADVFCTIEEGIKGKRAVQWRLVDELAPSTKLEERVAERAKEFAAKSPRKGRRRRREADAAGRASSMTMASNTVSFGRDRPRQAARHDHAARGRTRRRPPLAEAMAAKGAEFWPLRIARELDDAILDLRNNEWEIGDAGVQVGRRRARK